MGTRRSRHNKGRKPLYKEHRRGGASHDALNAADVAPTRTTLGLAPPMVVPPEIAVIRKDWYGKGSVRAYTRPATRRVLNAGFNYLSDLIIRPGIEKRFWPILLYRGAMRPGHAHRLWNFALLMMASEAETLSDGIKIANNPAFSQLCGPVRPPPKMTLNSFFGRLWENPDTTDLIPGFTEYVRSLELGPSMLYPVPLETYAKNGCAPWRVNLHPNPRKPGEHRPERGAPQLFYPYAMHDTAKPDEGHDLIKIVNAAVPRTLPEQWRADVCQELIVGILSGAIQKGDAQNYVDKFIHGEFKKHSTKYVGDGYAGLKFSFDAPLGSRVDEQRTLHDVMHDDSYQHWSDQQKSEEPTDLWERAEMSLAAKDYHYEQMEERHRHFDWMKTHGHASQIDDLFHKQVKERQIQLQEQGVTLHHHEVAQMLEDEAHGR